MNKRERVGYMLQYAHICVQGWLQGYVIGWGVKANLTNSCRSMLRFDQLKSVDVEV